MRRCHVRIVLSEDDLEIDAVNGRRYRWHTLWFDDLACIGDLILKYAISCVDEPVLLHPPDGCRSFVADHCYLGAEWMPRSPSLYQTWNVVSPFQCCY
jgi:hypothetical protein